MADDQMDSPTASDGASSTDDQQQQQQEHAPSHVESSKTWAIPTANFKPRPIPQHQASSASSKSAKKDHLNMPEMKPMPDFASKAPKNHIEIPKITPMSSDAEPSRLAVGLEGKYVDEFGNILEDDGTVLGRVEGDLPTMIGRPVSKSGEILDADGEVAGYVCENLIKPTLRALGGGLQVDSTGKIYDGEGNVVGNLNNTPHGERLKASATGSNDLSSKPSATPSPSEIYLDVKSTHDGIQLIIKIPTVFKSEQEKS